MKKLVWTLPVILVALVLIVSLSLGKAFAGGNNTHRFSSSGTGAETSLSPSGCQNTGIHDCTVQTNGTATSSQMGTGPYTTTLTVHWGQAYSNGNGGFCAPADGPSTLTAANGTNQLYFNNSGTVCEVGATGTYVPHTFSGTYTITGGTGKFAGATGQGTVTGGDDGYGNSNFSTSGTLSD
jgi:hypothetical protein